MLYLSDRQFVTVWKIEDKGKYSEVQMSSSRKDKQSNEYVNSSWSFVRFVGDAHKKIDQLERGSRIIIKGAISKEPYEKDGETCYPQNPRIVVFNFEFPEEGDKPKSDKKSSGTSTKRKPMDEPPAVEEDEEEWPF